MSGEQLFELAMRAREHSYSPYSHFAVGAALLCADGSVYMGANIENASYGATCCAERVAIFKALSEGKTKFLAIAIAGGSSDAQKNGEGLTPCYPCGICRQVLSEFCREDLKIFVGKTGEVREMTLGELLPHAFELEN